VTNRIGVVTIVSGRHDHLRAQDLSLDGAVRRPDVRIVVAMDDPSVRAVVDDGPFGPPARAVVVELPCSDDGRLPLAAARNVGATSAVDAGADLLVFLDVDCLAAPDLLSTYASAWVRVKGQTTRPAILCSAVAYLPPLAPDRAGYGPADLAKAEPHPARPVLKPGHVGRADPRLFWSLSFAVAKADWRLSAGFDERYTGYGAEDTDFAQRVVARGGSMWWAGGAMAYHQWHPVSDPPVEHLEDIIRNANRFRRRWGWFPMEGWLEAFRALGMAAYDAERQCWRSRSDSDLGR
jgi:N-acetylglucosaminyl-diphospho-decaprenol L-rhamnosyltransferase